MQLFLCPNPASPPTLLLSNLQCLILPPTLLFMPRTLLAPGNLSSLNYEKSVSATSKSSHLFLSLIFYFPMPFMQLQSSFSHSAAASFLSQPAHNLFPHSILRNNFPLPQYHPFPPQLPFYKYLDNCKMYFQSS